MGIVRNGHPHHALWLCKPAYLDMLPGPMTQKGGMGGMGRKINVAIISLFVFSLIGCGRNHENTKINALIASGRNQEAIQMINNGYDINQVQNSVAASILSQNEINGGSLLYTACKAKNHEMVKYLLINGADPNYAGYNQEYPFEIFLGNSYTDEDAFNLFIEKGADFEKHMVKPPIIALMSHYPRVNIDKQEIIEREVKILISHGINWRNETLDEQYGGYSILHFVAATDRTDFMCELLSYDEAAQYINSRSNTGETPYDIAKQNGQPEMCAVLNGCELPTT